MPIQDEDQDRRPGPSSCASAADSDRFTATQRGLATPTELEPSLGCTNKPAPFLCGEKLGRVIGSPRFPAPHPPSSRQP
ncbi:hypothetical protein B0T26DRAFT_311406 [Lasiosphaeria miniovina]|uniref:Uncharacterized protein n=1 Tax=Lasiosphaeria miniovina TaxID=1954250 RepID=A0AA40ALJ8_9PEZI|nr:uncharacterized protein B0T26DRAFT_311406 [Lasiosphaeria miniovina]KAK0718073.1 hypothetical protein B0T26DRAFT_311406 [Lasiosphaeria miniovina]